MEVVYIPPQDYSAYNTGDTLRKTQPIEAEVSRIMNWNYDIAKPDAPRSIYSGTSGARTTLTHRPRYVDMGDDPILLRRSITTSTIIEGPPFPPSESPSRDTSKSDSSITAASAGMYGLLGAAVGAAAGAAMTYGMMTKDRQQAPRQEFCSDDGPVPSFQRRGTFPEQKVNFTAAPQYHHPPPPMPGQRYVELERTVEKIRYPEDFATNGHYPHPPAYVARYSQVGAPSSSKKGDALDDSKSRYSSKYRGDRLIREAPAVAQVPLLLTETEHRSHVGSSISRHSTVKPPLSEQRSYAGSKYVSSSKPPPAAPNPPPPTSTTRRSTYESTTDRDTYVSARSHRSSSTLRGDPAPPVETEVYGSYPPPAGSGRSSRAKSSATVRGRDRDIDEAPKDRSHSRASTKFERLFPMPNNPVARHYPLPPSHDGRSLYSAHEMPLPHSSSSSKNHRSSSGRKSHYHEPQPLTRGALGENDRATWEEWDEDDDDDAVSLAPSDSISCVGSKKSSRSRR